MARKICAVSGCGRVCVGFGYCSPHYQRWTNHGDVFAERPIGVRRGQYNGRWDGGKSTHPLIEIYRDLVRRCTNPNHAKYADHGGRGISVCQEWLDDFWTFVSDVGPRPEGKTNAGRAYWQLDRIDNNGNYEAQNVRWATPSQQAKNKRGFGDGESRRDPITGRYVCTSS